MDYKLIRKRYLTVVTENPFNREFNVGEIFKKIGANESHVVLQYEHGFLYVSKRALRNDFESKWG